MVGGSVVRGVCVVVVVGVTSGTEVGVWVAGVVFGTVVLAVFFVTIFCGAGELEEAVWKRLP